MPCREPPPETRATARPATVNVHFFPALRRDDKPDQTPAVLHEISALLETLAVSGDSGGVDLRRFGLSPHERRSLRELLGTGEVEARLKTLGTTSITETATPGVWWITHRNDVDAIVGELIEVTTFPELFATSLTEVRSGIAGFRSRLGERQQRNSPANGARRLRELGVLDREPVAGPDCNRKQRG